MVSDLTAEMVQLVFRSVNKHVDEMPANDATSRLIHQYKQILQLLQTRAQEIDNHPETTETFTWSIRRVSKMIDQVEEQTPAKFVMRLREPVEPFVLVKLLEAWDRIFPGGSVAVVKQLEETMARNEGKFNTSQIAKELTQ